MTLRTCSVPGCPSLTDHNSGKCDDHRRETQRAADAQRPSSAGRGYGPVHRQLRRRWARKVDAGEVLCSRCHLPIVPGTPWDLGHDDNDRSRYSGPEHAACNRATKTIPAASHAR